MRNTEELKEKIKYAGTTEDKLKLLWMWSKQGTINQKKFIELNRYVFSLWGRDHKWEEEYDKRKSTGSI